ncbi:MAG: ATP-binding protein [Gammaproteobacteria bacterium]|nr:ATP-binding protein [Gammaproteobacteria bacterium]MDH4313775.1 ATP-binding protein [Gammaproteobacteria bacterium]MDH5213495.1 ATP-binding protein [Gammaproteobacteria bacterium]MDH5499880.1 ATP-binding protein [Gammaproteobacteria bacterium]
MRSLLLRIFVAFWSIILITIAVAAAIGHSYAERTRIALQNFEVGDAVLEASAALQENGREGLTDWLRNLPGPAEKLFYVVDDKGKDLLGRRLPEIVRISLRRFGDRESRPKRAQRDQPNLRPARPFTQLIGPDEREYTVFVVPPHSVRAKWLADRGLGGLIVLALIVSAVASFILAQTLSRPIRQLRSSANAIAEGRLDTRVAEGVGKRRDELGLLAADFDRMADELQSAWQKQTELTRNVSHELRSPLARLRVALELARRKTGDLAELDRIDLETERLNELIGQILEYSRLDVDSAERLSNIDLGELLHSVVDDVRFEHGYPDSGVNIEFDSEDSCTINGFPGALRSCFENVLRNAVQHGRNGGDVRVRLGIESSQAIVAVEDQGGGVPEQELAKIFEPFYRLGSKQGPARQSGLGLAIASRAATLNGGTIRASNHANGLRVEIRLPLAT